MPCDACHTMPCHAGDDGVTLKVMFNSCVHSTCSYSASPEPIGRMSFTLVSEAEQNKSWGIGARHRQQLAAQKQQKAAPASALAVSGPSIGDYVFFVV